MTFVSGAALKNAALDKLGLAKDLRGGEEHARSQKARHGAQRLPAEDQRRSGDLRGARRRRAPHLRAGGRAAAWRSATSFSDGGRPREARVVARCRPPDASACPSSTGSAAASARSSIRARRSGSCCRAASCCAEAIACALPTVAYSRSRRRRRSSRTSRRRASRASPITSVTGTYRSRYGEGFLRILRDHVLEDMVRHLGARVEHVEEPFEPEAGAYHSHEHHHG